MPIYFDILKNKSSTAWVNLDILEAEHNGRSDRIHLEINWVLFILSTRTFSFTTIACHTQCLVR